MTLTEAKELVKIFPKKIGNYRRNALRNNIGELVSISYMAYLSPDGFGYCKGDGHIYGKKIDPSNKNRTIPDWDNILV